MIFAKPEYSRGEVERAGAGLARAGDLSPVERAAALTVVNNWRAAHVYPLNTFQATLRDKLTRLGVAAVVGQRLKRLPSIIGKLQRQPTMNLQQMQDIAGLRAVVANSAAIGILRRNYEASRFQHRLIGVDDYIENPKPDGYRSLHLKYRYRSQRAPAYNGLNVELQIRTQLQHTWATSVETVDTFTHQAIKAGRPQPGWGEFFALASAIFAIDEGQAVPPAFRGVTYSDLREQLYAAERQLAVRARLRGYTIAADQIHATGKANAAWHVVVLKTDTRRLFVYSFAEHEQARMNTVYAHYESRSAAGEPLDTVLVRGGDLRSLRKAYPNYFLDTTAFVGKLNEIAHGVDQRRAKKALHKAMGIP
ncbi:MAG TPA: RelA/SpoT domain-containing protein [Stenotrophomonas sp.]|nr:RelA/SpoT domain-containing protein [Stenotrophomonas sp.]